MIEKGIRGLTASQLRIILIGSIIGIVAISGIGFYFLQGELTKYAVHVSHVSEDAATSGSDISVLKNLQKQLDQNKLNIERTQSIVAESRSYEYQPVIVKDLNTFAARSGITIASFVFDSGTTGKAPTPGAAATGAAGTGQAAPISGLKSTAVSITLQPPTKYENLLNFIHDIEQNLTKMQIASISLTKGTTAQEVATNALLIEVYIR